MTALFISYSSKDCTYKAYNLEEKKITQFVVKDKMTCEDSYSSTFNTYYKLIDVQPHNSIKRSDIQKQMQELDESSSIQRKP